MAIVEHLAKKVGVQRGVLLRHRESCDWSSWNPTKGPVDKWAGSILMPASRHYAGRWSNPVAPVALYDRAAGLVTTWYPALASTQSPKWVEDRIARDLDLLYGVRNAAVHEGVRIGNDQLARYLGRLGVELLYDEMANWATNIFRKMHRLDFIPDDPFGASVEQLDEADEQRRDSPGAARS